MIDKGLKPDIIQNEFDLESREKFSLPYLGIIEDNDDPLRIGRCKIRVSAMHSEEIPVEYLPWANPRRPIMFGKAGKCGSISIPKVGAVVEVTFSNDDQYNPEYQVMTELADDLKEELQKEYFNTHFLLYDGDEDVKIFYTPQRGVHIYNKGSFVNVNSDKSITIEHDGTTCVTEWRGGTITHSADSQVNTTAGTRIKNSSNEVWVDGKTTKVGHQPQYSAMLGEPFFAMMKIMAAAIDAKMYPTPNVMVELVNKYQKLILSDTVKVSK